MSYGPNPWQQTQWDWRAAGNFICGGAGGGLIAMAACPVRKGLGWRRCCWAAWRWSAPACCASGSNSADRCARGMCSSIHARRG